MHQLPFTLLKAAAPAALPRVASGTRRGALGSGGPLQTEGPQQACALDIEMGALLRFKSLMALDGETVQVARMCYDTDYAHDRIAQAHASGHDPLQRLALELFQAYHRRSELGRPRHSA
jgi:hypothetical protein